MRKTKCPVWKSRIHKSRL